MAAEDFEQDDRDFLCAISGLVFLPIALIIMGVVMYFVGGPTVSVISVIMLIIILVGFSAIETWSDRYGKNIKKI